MNQTPQQIPKKQKQTLFNALLPSHTKPKRPVPMNYSQSNSQKHSRSFDPPNVLLTLNVELLWLAAGWQVIRLCESGV
jgi:hypothetical protein